MRCFPNLILSHTDKCILLISLMWMNISMTHQICFATHIQMAYASHNSPLWDPELENTFQQQVRRQRKQIIGHNPILKSQLQQCNDPPSLCRNDVYMTVPLPGYTKATRQYNQS